MTDGDRKDFLDSALAKEGRLVLTPALADWYIAQSELTKRDSPDRPGLVIVERRGPTPKGAA